MKYCYLCNIEVPAGRSKCCATCRPVHLKNYQKNYRENNRKLCQERSKRSFLKKYQKYIDKRRETYRKKHGIALDDPFRKRKAGEGGIDSQGYKTITKRGHPNQMDNRGRIREHIYVMSEYLKRPLIKGETVHHKNGIRDDNRIENLELWHRSQPAGQRVKDKITWAIEFLILYGYKVLKE